MRTMLRAYVVPALAALHAGPAPAPAAPSSVPEQPRVALAHAHYDRSSRALFAERGMAYPPRALLLRGFKRERVLELWAGASDEPGTRLTLVKTFPICAMSGALGPKRREGDGQVPEGFYTVSGFNPASAFHLSMRISYPNASDRAIHRAEHSSPSLGGDIFIHGGCVTVGCLPLGDDAIEELYTIAHDAHEAWKAPIAVHLFPTRLDDSAVDVLARAHRSDPATVARWRNLKQGYDAFQRSHSLNVIRIDTAGNYRFSSRPALHRSRG